MRNLDEFMQDNCKMVVSNYKKLRRKDANCFATALFVPNASTFELIKTFVNWVAEKHKDKKFVIEHDGIITFSVKCDNEVIFSGTHYDVESMLQESIYTFKDLLLSKIS